MKSSLTHRRAAEVLRYEHDSGRIFCRVNRGPRARAGAEAGGVLKNGRLYYRQIMIDGKLYRGHRIAWLLVYGKWPANEIDHLDGDGLNNRIGNLRDVSGSTNQRNARMHGHNTSGVSGVCWDMRSYRWRARISLDGKDKYLGLFSTIEEAATARSAANLKYGFTARHGH